MKLGGMPEAQFLRGSIRCSCGHTFTAADPDLTMTAWLAHDHEANLRARTTTTNRTDQP